MILLLVFDTPQDLDKFEYLFTKYKRLMLHKAYGILKDYMLAEDAASEAFIRVYKNLHKIEDPTSPKAIAFLITIVKNVSLTMLEKERRVGLKELDDRGETDSFDLEGHIIAELGKEELLDMVDSLGEELKSVFLLKYAYDLSHKEIGRILGITENNVTVRLHRAKKKLSAILRKEGLGK